MQTEVCALAPLVLPGAESNFRTPNTELLAAVAIFHLSVKTISRSAGRSATAAAAYRAGEKILDHQTGEVFDYERKAGVESAEMFLPAGAPSWASEREKLWNAAEQSETRKNSTVAREFEVALPAELTLEEREALAHDFTRALVRKYGFAADCAIHSPHSKENQNPRKNQALVNGDSRNHHAHILCSTRKLEAEGFTAKTRTLDDRASGAEQVVECRALFAQMTNAALEKAGHSARVDHRSLVAQGIEDREACIHLGPTATAIERRGEVSEKMQHHQARQREAAGKVYAMLAIAQAQAKAAEEAAALTLAQAQAKAEEQAKEQAAARAAAQARALAISAQLTALKESENDRVRDQALSLIDSHVRAASRHSRRAGQIDGFIQSDHASIGNDLGAASGDLGSALQGAERRVAEGHYGRVVGAARRQFERVGGVVQQAGQHIEHVVRAVAAAAHQVAQQVAAKLELVRQQAAAKLVDIDPRSRYHPENIAKREAQEAAAAYPAPRMAVPDRLEIERRPVQQARPAPPSPPQLTKQQQVDQVIQRSIDTQARWEEALLAERALYLKELTELARLEACAHVVEHEAHLKAKPLLFGREKWELQLKRFEREDENNRYEWDRLKTGRYPSVAREKEAVQEAVEQRVSDKNPELARALPNALAILQIVRERVAAEKHAQWVAERQRDREAREAREASHGKDKARGDQDLSR